MRFWTWAQLHERGILPSRQHTRRLIERGVLPRPFRLGDPKRGRLTWLESDIEAYIARKAAEREQPRPREVDRADGNVIVPLRRGRRSHHDADQRSDLVHDIHDEARKAPPSRERIILRRPTR